MTPNPGISALLRHARLTALQEVSGKPATLEALASTAEIIHATIMRQVSTGLWSDYGVRDVAQMRELVVEVVLGDTGAGDPPIKINYDFARTALPALVVENAWPS